MSSAVAESKYAGANKWEWRQRSLAAAVHLLLMGVLLLVCLQLFVSRWYPDDFRQLSGGWTLLVIVLSVDLCLGPLLTWAVFDIRKSRMALWRDLSAVGLVQFAALLYGISVLAESRPVALVFAVDRFALVAAGNLRMQELPFVAPEVRHISWQGPVLFGTRESHPSEVLDSVSLATQGFDLAQRPTYWQAYEQHQQKAFARAQPIAGLWAKHGLSRESFCAQFRAVPCEDANAARYLPLEAQAGEGSVLLAEDGRVLGLVPLSGFD